MKARENPSIKKSGWNKIISFLNQHKDMNRDMSDEEVEKFVADAIREVRKQK